MMRLWKLAIAGVCAIAVACAAPARTADPVRIRMSWVAPLANWGSTVLEKKDLATHLGKSYTLETVHYQGTPQMITAIANNELEVASLAYSSLAIAIENAGLDLRVISDEFQDGVPGYFSTEFYVRNDSPLQTVEDLKGKVIGTNGGGSAVDIAARAMLKQHGLEDKRDFTMLEGFGWLFTKQDVYRDPDMMPNLEALQKNIDDTQKLGFIRKRIDIRNYADVSLVKDAKSPNGVKINNYKFNQFT